MSPYEPVKTADYDYELPPELIAQKPAERREEARMLVLDRKQQTWGHRCVTDMPSCLNQGDRLVLNNTRVIPARVFGRKEGTGGKVEFLLLEELENGDWDVLMRCSRRPKVGARILFGDECAVAELLADGEKGRARVRITSERPFLEVIDELGFPPLPPYISRDYAEGQGSRDDKDRYQTIYAENPGAVAAPTAGLHFSEALFDDLAAKGVNRSFLTLHVGIGTFRPVSVDDIREHKMDSERYEVSAETASAIRRTQANNGRVVAVGSTSVRTLESVATEHDTVVPCSGRTDCFIYPPYEFKIVDAMLTNFHLPRSTLLMMVCALAGREFVLKAYEAAVKEKYRFYSYGDCMLIL